MNAVFIFLSGLAGQLAEPALAMLWQSAILIAVVAVADGLLRRRLSATARHALWILVLVKLLLPPSLTLPTSPAWWWPASLARSGGAAGQPGKGVAGVSYNQGGREGLGHPDEEGRPSAGGEVSWRSALPAVLLLIWAAGAAVLSGCVIRRWIWVKRLRQEAEAAAPDIQNLADEWCFQLGLRRRVPVYITSQFQTPAVCGWLHPFILLPSNALDRLPSGGLRSVVLHELVHIRRGDLWLNHLQAVLQMIWWFNPLLWLANNRIRALREEAVDERVLAQLVWQGEDCTAYPSALVAVAKLHLKSVDFGLALVGIMDGRSALHRRVHRLLTLPEGWSPARGWVIAIAVAVAGLILLPMGRTSEKQPEPALVVAQPETADDILSDPQFRKVEDILNNAPEKADHEVPLYTRTFRVNQPDFMKGVDAVTGSMQAGGSTNPPDARLSAQLRIRNLFRAAGIEFSTPEDKFGDGGGQDLGQRRALFFNERTGTLFVRASEAELDTVEKVIQALTVAPPQVLIEARFIGGKRKVLLKALGNAMAGNAANSILSQAELLKLETDLKDTDGIDILSAPRVTTLSGRQAQISVTDLIPVFVPESKATNMVPVGPMLDVTPYVTADGGRIQLKSVAELYEIRKKANGQPEKPAKLRVRTASANALLKDGDTLIMELKDIPAMVHKSIAVDKEQKSKPDELSRYTPGPSAQNLPDAILVFITPRIIDPAGRPVHPLSNPAPRGQ